MYFDKVCKSITHWCSNCHNCIRYYNPISSRGHSLLDGWLCLFTLIVNGLVYLNQVYKNSGDRLFWSYLHGWVVSSNFIFINKTSIFINNLGFLHGIKTLVLVFVFSELSRFLNDFFARIDHSINLKEFILEWSSLFVLNLI